MQLAEAMKEKGVVIDLVARADAHALRARGAAPRCPEETAHGVAAAGPLGDHLLEQVQPGPEARAGPSAARPSPRDFRFGDVGLTEGDVAQPGCSSGYQVLSTPPSPLRRPRYGHRPIAARTREPRAPTRFARREPGSPRDHGGAGLRVRACPQAIAVCTAHETVRMLALNPRLDPGFGIVPRRPRVPPHGCCRVIATPPRRSPPRPGPSA